MKTLKKLVILSAHEGSDAFSQWLNRITKSFKSSYRCHILTDTEYRRLKNFKLLYYLVLFIAYPIKLITSLRYILHADKLLILTNPFFLPILCDICFWNKKKVILHNEVFHNDGFHLKIHKLIFNSTFFLNHQSKAMRNACANIFISPEHYNKNKAVKNSYLVFTPGSGRNKKRYFEMTNKKIFFAGNLSSFHICESNISTIIEIGKNMPIDFYVAPMLQNKLKRFFNSHHIEFHDSIPHNQFQDIQGEYSYGLVILSRHAERIIFPSKISEYISSNIPILLICPDENLLTKFISKNKIGFWLNQNNVKKKIKTLLSLNTSDYHSLVQNLSNVSQQYIKPTRTSKKMIGILNQ